MTRRDTVLCGLLEEMAKAWSKLAESRESRDRYELGCDPGGDGDRAVLATDDVRVAYCQAKAEAYAHAAEAARRGTDDPT